MLHLPKDVDIAGSRNTGQMRKAEASRIWLLHEYSFLMLKMHCTSIGNRTCGWLVWCSDASASGVHVGWPFRCIISLWPGFLPLSSFRHLIFFLPVQLSVNQPFLGLALSTTPAPSHNRGTRQIVIHWNRERQHCMLLPELQWTRTRG